MHATLHDTIHATIHATLHATIHATIHDTIHGLPARYDTRYVTTIHATMHATLHATIRYTLRCTLRYTLRYTLHYMLRHRAWGSRYLVRVPRQRSGRLALHQVPQDHRVVCRPAGQHVSDGERARVSAVSQTRPASMDASSNELLFFSSASLQPFERSHWQRYTLCYKLRAATYRISLFQDTSKTASEWPSTGSAAAAWKRSVCWCKLAVEGSVCWCKLAVEGSVCWCKLCVGANWVLASHLLAFLLLLCFVAAEGEDGLQAVHHVQVPYINPWGHVANGSIISCQNGTQWLLWDNQYTSIY